MVNSYRFAEFLCQKNSLDSFRQVSFCRSGKKACTRRSILMNTQIVSSEKAKRKKIVSVARPARFPLTESPQSSIPGPNILKLFSAWSQPSRRQLPRRCPSWMQILQRNNNKIQKLNIIQVMSGFFLDNFPAKGGQRICRKIEGFVDFSLFA